MEENEANTVFTLSGLSLRQIFNGVSMKSLQPENTGNSRVLPPKFQVLSLFA